jgi:hypothetical protein
MRLSHKALELGLAALCVGFVAILGVHGASGDPPDGKGGGGGGGGGGADQDLDVCITLSGSGGVVADGGGAYCASEKGNKVFVGRNRGIWLVLGDKPNQQRRIKLVLGDRLPDIEGDPDPNNDGGVLFQPAPGDWSTHPLPEIPPEGIVGEFTAAHRVNVLHMGEPGQEPNPNDRNGRLKWLDPDGRLWHIQWGPYAFPKFANPNAPKVRVTRLDDGNGNLINQWDVVTLGDAAPERAGAATAFLWREVSPNGQHDYCGAFDLAFEFTAAEEP